MVQLDMRPQVETMPGSLGEEPARAGSPLRALDLARCSPSPLRLECSVCLDEAELTDTLELARCEHVFCRACIRAHCLAQQSEGSHSVACLAVGCSNQLSQTELMMVLDDTTFQTFDRRALEQAVSLDRSLHLCPTPDCPFVCAWSGPEDGPPMVMCPVCQKDSCLVCGRSPYHEGRSCLDPAPQPSATAMATASASAPQATSSPIDDEAATLAFIARSNIKLCPRCKNGVVKEEGCDKLKCRCGYRFCWNCGSENAQCGCTPSNHGFIDNLTGHGDFSNLRATQSPT